MDEQLRMQAWLEIANHFNLDFVSATEIFDPSGSLESLSFNALMELQRMIDSAFVRRLRSEGHQVQ